MLSYFKTVFEAKQFLCCVIKVDRKVKYIFVFIDLVVFFLCLFPFEVLIDRF